MNRGTIVLTAILLAFANVFCDTTQAAEPNDGFVKLFDGKTLADWDGNSEAWAVRDGAITCLGRQGGKNWLIWRGGELGDFELRLKFKYLAGNSGVQVRSEEIEKWKSVAIKSKSPNKAKWDFGTIRSRLPSIGIISLLPVRKCISISTERQKSNNLPTQR